MRTTTRPNAKSLEGNNGDWSGRWESNTRPKLGKTTRLCRSCTVISFLEGATWPANQPPKPGKDLGKKSKPESPAKSHRINGPFIFVCPHNPKVVSSNLTPATISKTCLSTGLRDE